MLLCGVDEAGRGPLAGAVYAAAVILDPARPIDGLADSKVLSEARRDDLALAIRERALAWHVASASVEEIDTLNILKATLLAMKRACDGLGIVPDLIQVDGNRVPPGLPAPAEAVVKGDAKVRAISAASILAKTSRDAELYRLDALYPEYGFARHKGYPTAEHLAALERLGPLAEHRKSFGPVKARLAAGQGELF
ncbi:ribonuclease HII [Paludibacterium paludis]|uniref:Ribonuclease HII n=1 Tax=Paludibacterium paludis TaxID=1225769 RepID=A0A918P6C8_9NEIS|nr:ribonuclease HII [Paludibacterium paludis]GGY25532.1 ribonuclease HII [Paludibacterium paludis]